jgi:RNA polymerase sigma-70 factor (ECF subfamily)
VTTTPKVEVADLFNRHGRAVRHYLHAATGSAELAEDLAQDVFVRVVRGVGEYEPRERERAWLFRIARNILLDHRRRLAARPSTRRVDTEPAVAATQVLSTDLAAALARVPDTEREAFLLAELGGLTYDEIARVLLITVPAVRSCIYRARLALRALLLAPAPIAPQLVKGPFHDDE